MTDDFKKRIDVLLRDGRYAEIEKHLLPYMKKNPGDWEAKLLFGTCRMMQGDRQTAKFVYRRAVDHKYPVFAFPAEKKSFWKKYKNVIIWTVFGVTLILLGAAACWGGQVKCLFAPPVPSDRRLPAGEVKEGGKPEAAVKVLPAGPDRDRKPEVKAQKGKESGRNAAAPSWEDLRRRYNGQKLFLFQERNNTVFLLKDTQPLAVCITRKYSSPASVPGPEGGFSGRIVCRDPEARIRALLSVEKGRIEGWNLLFDPQGYCTGAAEIRNRRLIEARIFRSSGNVAAEKKAAVLGFNVLVRELVQNIAAGKYTSRAYRALKTENMKESVKAPALKEKWNGISFVRKRVDRRILHLSMFMDGGLDGCGLCFDENGTLLAEESWRKMKLSRMVYFTGAPDSQGDLLKKIFAESDPFFLRPAPVSAPREGTAAKSMLDLQTMRRYSFPPQGHREETLGLYFPRDLNGFTAAWLQTYGKKALGYSFRYHLTNGKADIYIYDPVFSGKSDEILSKELLKEQQQMKLVPSYSNVSDYVIREGAFTAIPSMKYKYAEFSYRHKVGAGLYIHYRSFTLLTLMDNKLIKFRFSCLDKDSGSAEREFEYFIKQFDLIVLAGRTKK